MTRSKTLKAVLIWTAGIAVSVLLLLFLAQQFLGPEVKKLFVTEINKSLFPKYRLMMFS
ncbi:MAG: hypothetical protein U0Z17_03110 [Bacteroidales bacterium]